MSSIYTGSPPFPVPDWTTFGQRPKPLGFGGFNGIPWGPGMPIQTQPGYRGFDETPDQMRSDQSRTNADGSWSARAYTGPRTITIPFVVIGQSPDQLQQMLATIEMVWDPDGVTWGRLWSFQSQRFLNAQITSRTFTQALAGNGQSVATGVVQWFCGDPYWYGADTSFQVGVQVLTGGMVFPLTFPLVFGTVVSGLGNAYNPGLRTPLRIHIPGPTTHPFVGSDTQGVGLDLPITLGPADYLDIDSGAKTIVLDGNVPRNDLLTGLSSFFDVLHGSNQFRFRSQSGAPGEVATGTWNPRWR